MFAEAQFLIATDRKQPKCLSRGEWIQKLGYIHAVDFYSATKNALLTHATTWTNPKVIMLNERSQIKQKYILYNSFI